MTGSESLGDTLVGFADSGGSETLADLDDSVLRRLRRLRWQRDLADLDDSVGSLVGFADSGGSVTFLDDSVGSFVGFADSGGRF